MIEIERRGTPRIRCTEKHPVSWKPSWLGLRRNGLLYDLSETGLSLMVDANDSPRVDQTLALTSDLDGTQLEAQVVRIQPISNGRVLVGCRLAEPIQPRLLIAAA